MAKTIKKKVVLKGIAASPGRVLGRVKLVKSFKKIPTFKTNEIVVARYLGPDFITLIKKYHSNPAIVTDRGGATSHIAILARELKIPYVAGVQFATKQLKENMLISMDGQTGIIHKIA